MSPDRDLTKLQQSVLCFKNSQIDRENREK